MRMVMSGRVSFKELAMGAEFYFASQAHDIANSTKWVKVSQRKYSPASKPSFLSAISISDSKTAVIEVKR